MEGLELHERLARVMGFTHIDIKNHCVVECVIFVFVSDFVSSKCSLACKADYAKMCVDEYVSAMRRIPDHQFMNPSLKLTMSKDYHDRRGKEKEPMGEEAFVHKMKDSVECVRELVTEIPGAARLKDLPSRKSLEDMINKFIIGKWLEDLKVRGYLS